MINIVVASITNQVFNLIEFSGGSLLDIDQITLLVEGYMKDITLKNGEQFTTNVE